MFDLAFPWALVLLPLPFILRVYLPRAAFKSTSALRVPFFNKLLKLKEFEQKNRTFSGSVGALFLIWSLVVLALSGPRWVGPLQPLKREGHNILLTLDISASMELPDRVVKGQQVTRLSVVKAAALRFVQERRDDKIGLILFGSQAYLQTPLTYDHKNVEMRLEDATVGLAGKSTSIGDALGLAVKNFQQVSPKGRVIILLTDGVNNSGVLTPQKAAEFAHMDGIKVYTIGLGSDEMVNAFSGAFFQMGLGQPDLDEDTLKEVARKTGGRYFRATDLQSLDRIYDQINQLEATEQSPETVRPQQEYYPWLLALALMCSFIGLMVLLHQRIKR